jgi:hypothetical protein
VVPSIGRAITVEDDPAAGVPAHVVVISDGAGREEFKASPDVLGQIVRAGVRRSANDVARACEEELRTQN